MCKLSPPWDTIHAFPKSSEILRVSWKTVQSFGRYSLSSSAWRERRANVKIPYHMVQYGKNLWKMSKFWEGSGLWDFADGCWLDATVSAYPLLINNWGTARINRLRWKSRFQTGLDPLSCNGAPIEAPQDNYHWLMTRKPYIYLVQCYETSLQWRYRRNNRQVMRVRAGSEALKVICVKVRGRFIVVEN